MSTHDDPELVDQFEAFFRAYYHDAIGDLARQYPSDKRSLHVSWDDLYRFDPSLADDYLAEPVRLQTAAEQALQMYDLPVDVDFQAAHVRLHELPETTPIRDLRAEDVTTMVAVSGIVRKATDVRPKVQEAAFRCQRCETLTYVPQTGGGMQEPHECRGCDRQGPFLLVEQESQLVDAQRLRVQESPEGLQGGETPAGIDVHIEDDITGAVTPGDRVTVTGVLQTDQDGTGSTVLDIYMDGVAVDLEEEQFEDMEITDADRQAIIELSERPDLYEAIVDSIAPSIYGYREEKLAIALQLFSGVTKNLADDSRIRGDLHILLIGDPGTGKSQLLQYIRNIAPRSVYTSGKGSSSAGLCVTGDTVIQTETGLRPIREIVEPAIPEPVDEETAVDTDARLTTFDRSSGSMDVRDASRAWRMPEKPCRRIETRQGKTLEASVSTPVLCRGANGVEWRPISELEPGDDIATPCFQTRDRTELPVRELLDPEAATVRLSDQSAEFLRESLTDAFGTLHDAAAELNLSAAFLQSHLCRYVSLRTIDRILDAIGASRNEVAFERTTAGDGTSIALPETFDEDLMYLLGLVFAAGDITPGRAGDHRGTVRLLSDDNALLDRAVSIFEDAFDVRPEIEHRDGRVSCIRVRNATITRLFANAGITTATDDLALAPELTTAAHADAFLRGLMDGEGTVSVRENGTSGIRLPTRSDELADQVQLMLEAYGVRARVRERDWREADEPRSGQLIASNHNQQFVELHGTAISRYADTIGFECAEKQAALSEIVGHRGHRETHVTDGGRPTVDGPAGQYDQIATQGDTRGRVPAQSMRNDSDVEPATEPVKAMNGAALRWDEVTAAVDTGHKEVFDLTVPETHNFVANGIVTHNTAAAVRDDFGDGQQWTLEAGALVLADQGIAAIDELDKMAPDDRSAMHEALEQQSYHRDTEVLLADGRRVAIGELVDDRMANRPEEVVDGVNCELLPVDDLRVHTADPETGATFKTPIDRVSRHAAPDEFVRVTFSNGRSVTVTPEHPLFVDDGNVVPAAAVEPGAFVPAPRKLSNSPGGVVINAGPERTPECSIELPEEVTPELAELLGVLVAGPRRSEGAGQGLAVSSPHDRLLTRVERLGRSVFGRAPKTVTETDTVTKRWPSTRLGRWFEANVPEVLASGRQQRIPAAVLGSSEEVIRRFLVGAVAGDGGAKPATMSFSAASRGLAEDYADALAKLGIASRIHSDDSDDGYKTSIADDSTDCFAEAVVAEAADHVEGTTGAIDRNTGAPSHHDVLPASAADELRSLRSLLGLPERLDPPIDEGAGVSVATLTSAVETLRERIETVRSELSEADSIADVRSAIGWSARKLDDRTGEPTGAVYGTEDRSDDEQRGSTRIERSKAAVTTALDEAAKRLDGLEQQASFRYYRVTDVETVPNEGKQACEWVYDVTVEPTNTFISKGLLLHNSVSVSKAGINATLKSRCSLLGAANPAYGRFDQYEPIGEQIDLEPALISRFDLIFTVTDQPDPEEDQALASHILATNYAGELRVQQDQMTAPDVDDDTIDAAYQTAEPEIDPELLRKYVAYAQQNCHPRMSDSARNRIKEFYVDLRSRGADEDAPVPVTARKLEALVRLAEASARIRLADTVTAADADRVIDIVRSSLQNIGVDPETGQFDADVIETGTSKSQRDRIRDLKNLIESLEPEYDGGVPVEEILEQAGEVGLDAGKAEQEIERLKQKGEIYEPTPGNVQTT